ncbi:MAG: trigger factor [Candidatus Electryoneaceae bacterium]|nr:trigger factor [Candidatus Electryoneaceae bacterium]
MKTKSDISPDREATLEVEIPAELFSEKYSEAIQNLQREVEVPGFRRGKVPLIHIRSRFGKKVMAELAEEMIRENLQKAIEQEKLDPGGKIDLENVEYGKDKPLTFTLRFPLQPEVNLVDYKNLRILLNDAEVTDDDVENHIKSIRDSAAVLQSVDTPAPANAHLKIIVQEVGPSGEPLIGRKPEEQSIEFGADRLGIGTDEQLFGISAGEKRIISTRQSGALASNPTQSLLITPGQATEQKQHDGEIFLSVETIKVEVPQPPELNDEFAQEINDQLSTVDDLYKWIKGNLLAYIARGKEKWLEKVIIARMIEVNPFILSPSIVRNGLEDMAENMSLKGDVRKHFFEGYYKTMEHQYRWMILQNAVIEAEGLEVTDVEIEQEIVRIAEMTGDPVEKVRTVFESEEGATGRLRDRLRDKRVLQFLAENAEIEPRMMDLHEFIRITETEDEDHEPEEDE